MDSTVAGLGAIVSVIVALVSLYFAIRKHPFDIQNLSLAQEEREAALAEKYMDMADKVTAANIKLRDDLERIRVQLEEVNQRHGKELSEIRSQLDEAIVRAAKFEDWAYRLVAQIKSLGEQPVPFEPRDRKSRPVGNG